LIVILRLWFGGWLWGIAGVALAVPVLVTAKALGLGLGRTEYGEPDGARRDESPEAAPAEASDTGTPPRLHAVEG
jgi:hypothetical protein